MDLKDYPRPPKDTGIGVHWSPGNSGSVGLGELRKTWIPQLQRMGVTWVKLLHPGGLELAEMLLAADIMPVVRIYRHRPNATDLRKATLNEQEIRQIKDYLAVGVRYFEFNNEPNLPSEWEGATLPGEEAIDYVARAAIIDMETILGLGGYPAVPATSLGCDWDLIGKIIEHGGDYLFDEPVWLAVHNYDINHPLDYPYDRVNRRGVPLTPKTYRRMGTDAWTGPRWGARTLAFINQQRQKGKNPRADIMTDAAGFLGFQRLAQLALKHLGRHLPIISTENGPIVGEDDDPRYPTTTPQIHADKVAEIARIMMGTSHRYDPAPNYYFATAFWLLGASVLRAKGWEGHAWFSPRWPNGHLPVVEALEQLPKHPRRFDDLKEPSPYPIHGPGHSQVSGTIYGCPNMRVIIRSATHAQDTYTDDQGRFRFRNLPRGNYRLSVPGAGIVHLGITLDGRNHVQLELGEPPAPEPPSPPASESGWRVQIEDKGQTHQGFGVILVSVQDQEQLPVHLSAAGWPGITRRTGTKPEYGPFALEFSPLGPGTYTIQPQGLDIQAQVKLESGQLLWIRFQPASTPQELEPPSEAEPQEPPPQEPPTEPPQAPPEAEPLPAPPEETTPQPLGSLRGTITHGAGMRVQLSNAQGQTWQTIADTRGRFHFPDLPPGSYQLSLPDIDFTQSVDIQAGQTQRLALEAPDVEVPHYSTISGQVRHGAGRTIILRGPEGEQTQTIGPDQRYLFTGLGPGRYYIRVQDTLARRSGLRMTGRNHRVVNFALPTPEPSQSIIQGRVPGGAGLQVYMRYPDGRELIQALDPEGNFQFEDLPAGEYELILYVDDAEYIEHVQVDGLHPATVDFNIPPLPEPEPQSQAEAPSPLAGATATPETPPAETEPPTPDAWTWRIEDLGTSPGFGIIRVRMPGAEGRAIRLWADGWQGMVRHIGDKPEYGPDVCEFAPLGKGRYYLQPQGLDLKAEIELPGAHELWVIFTPPGEKEPSSPQAPRPQPPTAPPLYILVRSLPIDLPGLIHLMRFAIHAHAPIGEDLHEALQAQHIILLASSEDLTPEEETLLKQHPHPVTRIAPPYYATRLAQLLAEGAFSAA